MRFFLAMIALLAPLSLVRADTIRLIYFEVPPLAEERESRASGPAVDLLHRLTEGLPVSSEIEKMPVKRVEHTLETEPSIAVGLGRIKRREAMGLVWVAEINRGSYYFVTLRGHQAIRDAGDAGTVKRIACNLGGAPAEILKGLGITNIDYAHDLRQEASKLHAGHVDAWFDRGLFIDATWRNLGYDSGDLIWSAPVEGPGLWIAASPKVPSDIVDTMRQRFAALKEQGKLDPVFSNTSR